MYFLYNFGGLVPYTLSNFDTSLTHQLPLNFRILSNFAYFSANTPEKYSILGTLNHFHSHLTQ